MLAQKAFNPFYAALVVTGVLFGVTALAYGAMAVIAQNDPERAHEAIESGEGFVAVVDKHGLRLLIIELAVLAVCTVLAIATDEYWTRRADLRSVQSVEPPATGGDLRISQESSSVEEGTAE